MYACARTHRAWCDVCMHCILESSVWPKGMTSRFLVCCFKRYAFMQMPLQNSERTNIDEWSNSFSSFCEWPFNFHSGIFFIWKSGFCIAVLRYTPPKMQCMPFLVMLVKNKLITCYVCLSVLFCGNNNLMIGILRREDWAVEHSFFPPLISIEMLHYDVYIFCDSTSMTISFEIRCSFFFCNAVDYWLLLLINKI